MGLSYGCKCGNAIGINQLTTMSRGVCARCMAAHQAAAMQQAQLAPPIPVVPAEKEVFGETIREQLAIGSSDDTGKGEQP